jgi:Cof subfamily protein (haloacid dehalogenase superfamily)
MASSGPDQAPGRAVQPVRMIATDIDGTMLRSDGTLSPRVKEALGAAVDAGIHVVPATGRPVIITADVIEAAELDEFWVFANGAVTRHIGRDELIRGFWMDHEVTRDLLGLLRRSMPDCGFAIELEDTVAFENGFERVVPVVPDVAPVDDLVAALDESAVHWQRVQKILVYDLSLHIDELFGRVSAVAGDRAVPSYSGLPFVELAAGLVTKATALELLAEDLSIAPAEVAAFGDNHNDLPMLAWAGRSYAMGNATDDAKETADEVIDRNDDDGLARKIEQLLDTAVP